MTDPEQNAFSMRSNHMKNPAKSPAKIPEKHVRRTPPSIESRIAECYDALSAIDQRLADVILGAPG
ncbi:MAG: hypothetical protein ACRYHA_17075, partial [Janthinobacterium lividum]